MATDDLATLRPLVENTIASVKDFPKKGIDFRDIMPLLRNPELMDRLCRAVANYAKARGKIDIVVGLEARGFLFGPQIAMNLGVPFVPIRKKGKLPGELVTVSYTKEYGQDTLELQKEAIGAGERVLIVDDLLAVGGTLAAAASLITKAGGVPSDAFVVIELAGLYGRAKLPKETHLETLVVYPGA